LFQILVVPGIYVSQGSVATHMRCSKYAFITDSDGERVLKIGQ